MELRLDVLPIEDTTAEEVAGMAASLRDELGRSREIERVAPVRIEAGAGAKGILDELGAMMVGLPPGALGGLVDIIKAIIGRPRQPPVHIKLTAGSVDVTFDPKALPPERLAVLIDRLQAGMNTPNPAPG